MRKKQKDMEIRSDVAVLTSVNGVWRFALGKNVRCYSVNDPTVYILTFCALVSCSSSEPMSY